MFSHVNNTNTTVKAIGNWDERLVSHKNITGLEWGEEKKDTVDMKVNNRLFLASTLMMM